MSPRRRRLFSRRRRLPYILAGVAVLGLAAIGAGIYLYKHRHAGSVYHPHAPFTAESTPTSLPKRPEDRFSWPMYGYTKEHTRFFPAPERVRPPFRQLWERNSGALLEFPPVIYAGRIFQLSDNGVLYALNKHTGSQVWRKKIGQLSASTPAVTSNTIYATVLQTGHPRSPGRIVALNSHNGQIRWFRSLPSPTESSPMIDRGRIYFGSQNGTVYALDDSTGRVVWTYHAEGAVKASPTLSGGVLYFGDYSGHLQAISESNGHLIWRSGTGGGLFGSGTFYSTAAVYYGRVFLGNTDGRIYAYDASSGRLDWAVQTGSYVYASPAVTNAPGLGPEIYLGSYSGTFYALNARSGHVSWSFNAGGRISGSATIVGRIVYFADLGDRRTYGLGISTGRKLFQKETGAFDPVISDGKNIYLTGYTGLFGLAPR
jgi:outer membrane protein assembly factor BamB